MRCTTSGLWALYLESAMTNPTDTNLVISTVSIGVDKAWRGTLMVLVSTMLLGAAAAACSDSSETPDDCPGTYVCTNDDTGAMCEDTEDPACTCECVISAECTTDDECDGAKICNAEGACVEPEGPECTSDAECDGGTCNAAGICEAAPSFRFVLVEDRQTGAGGDYPGADIDSVELVKGDGTIIGAVEVEDFANDSSGNLAADPSQVLGVSDAACDADSGKFYAMGGEGNWMILSYGDAIIENGDSIDVVELGSTECGTFDDDSWAVSVSVSTDEGSFLELGDGVGSSTIAVSGL